MKYNQTVSHVQFGFNTFSILPTLFYSVVESGLAYFIKWDTVLLTYSGGRLWETSSDCLPLPSPPSLALSRLLLSQHNGRGSKR